MASIARRKNGARLVQFYLPNGQRRTLSLGRCSKRSAEQFRTFLERLIECRRLGLSLDGQTLQWLSGLSDPMYRKLHECGLVEPRQDSDDAPTLSEFLESYIAGRPDVKPATKVVWRRVARNLIDFFGSQRSVKAITPAEAEAYKSHLVASQLALTTASKYLQFARQFFRHLVKADLLTHNPFDGLQIAQGNPRDRQWYIDLDTTAKLIEAAPNVGWKTIIALCRFGGLRNPSEVLSLKWEHVDWQRRLIHVPQPKLEHHAGKESRVVPIFGLLAPHLEQAWEAAETGAVYVVAGCEVYRARAKGATGWLNTNLRTQFQRIIKRAGLTPWPRLFHNLRASLATDLVAEFPQHVVAS